MKLFLSFLVLVSAGVNCFAQDDSLTIKLKKYKALYTEGLIDSGEYAALKAKALGLEQGGAAVKAGPADYQLYYDTNAVGTILPAGVYMTMKEISSRNPSLRCSAAKRSRKTYDYQNGLGGNVILLPVDNCISKNDLKMDAWLYSDGVHCYMNLERLKLQGFYNPVVTMGRFLAFHKNESAHQLDMVEAYGGFIALEVVMGAGNVYKKLYVIDTQTAMMNVVDDEFMKKLLKDYPSLLTNYQAENHPNAITFASYLQRVNELK